MHVALKYKLQKSLTISSSAQGNFAHLLQCIESSLYHCLLFHEPLRKYLNTNINRICGVVNSGKHLKPYAWKINVHPKFSLNINFLHFRLSISIGCGQAYLKIDALGARPYMYPRVYGKYCGSRMPWSLHFLQFQATVKVFTGWGLAKGYYLVMTFGAFDIKLPSLGFIHKGQRLYKSYNYNWMSLERNPHFDFFTTEFQILFYAEVARQIILKFPTAPRFSHHSRCKDLPHYCYILSDVRVYDGPGILSSLVVPSCNTSKEYCTCHLSSYQDLIKYRIPGPSSFLDGYNEYVFCYEYEREQGILWETKEVLNSAIDCVRQGKYIHFHSQSGICWGLPFHSLIKIHFMDFSCYEMSDNLINCGYGGLFILLYKWRKNNYGYINKPIAICVNIDSEVVLPYEVHTPSIRMVIVFKTFKGYSHGSTGLTISYDPDCIGWNYMNTNNLQCHCRKDRWYSWIDHIDKKTQGPACSDFWLTHHVTDLLYPSDLEHCIFPFTMVNKLRHTGGSLKFMVSSSIIYQNFISVISSHNTSYFNMIIEGVPRRDYAFNPTTKATIFNLKLPTTSKQTFFFNIVSSLHVKFNYTGDFQQLIFVIRMQIVENVICSSVEDHHPLDITHIYALNSDISNVYLSRIYPYNGYMIKAMNYTGHNRGSCRVLLKGQSCSHSSFHKVIQIHYRPNVTLEAAHRIQISMKRTLNCSFHCPLNVRIWEVRFFTIMNGEESIT